MYASYMYSHLYLLILCCINY